MADQIPGLHHVTAISGPAQRNVDFYTSVLEQRLVKRTVNFDDPGTYHLYYGDQHGAPGTIMTFFPFADAGRGRAGRGMASAFAYQIPAGSLGQWMEKLADAGIDFEGPAERFGTPMLTVHDPDGLIVELIEAPQVDAPQGFHSVTLSVRDAQPTLRLLTDIFGYEAVGTAHDGGPERTRLTSPSGALAAHVDVVEAGGAAPSRPGAGTIHHVAFRAESDDIQATWRERLISAGFDVTPIIDRQYFNAIYFREPGGILFEIATDPPGFATDEPLAELGQHLKLPPRYEAHRDTIERTLPPLKVPA
ncbi:MAG: ring-cleaving dioxygenase [Pseudomonadota bacterium]